MCYCVTVFMVTSSVFVIKVRLFPAVFPIFTNFHIGTFNSIIYNSIFICYRSHIKHEDEVRVDYSLAAFVENVLMTTILPTSTSMLKSLLLLVFLLSLQAVLCQQEGPILMGWPSWLLVDPEDQSHVHEKEDPPKPRRITPKSVFIAPAFSGSSPLPDCAEGYKADSMGRCVKLVQLNHPAQLNFLLQRLNAMYSTQDTNHGPEDSNSGPLHFTLPLDIPEPQQEETDESVEVAVVMADVLKDDKKKSEEDKAETIVAVWKTGKNGTELEEVETASDLEIEAAKIHIEKSNMTTAVSDNIKYDVVEDKSNFTLPDKRAPILDSENPQSDSPVTVSLENDSEDNEEPSKAMESAVELLEEVSSVIEENSRTGNTNRRNVSLDVELNDSNSTEEVSHSFTERSVVKKVLPNPEELIPTDITPELEVENTSENVKRPLSTNQQSSSYVRFPNDNNDGYTGGETSVSSWGSSYDSMNQDYEEFVPPPAPAYYQNTKVNQPNIFLPNVQQRPTYWWLPPGWRLDPSRHQPMLVRFWARMPLVRDPVYQHIMHTKNYHNGRHGLPMY